MTEQTIDPPDPTPPVIGARIEITGLDITNTHVTALEHDQAAVSFTGPGGTMTALGPIPELHLMLRDAARKLTLLERSNQGPPPGGRLHE